MKQCISRSQSALSRSMFRFLIFLLLLSLTWGCNSHSSQDDDEEQTSSPPGTASGQLVVPATATLETEPNNTPAQAQVVTPATTLSGLAAASDGGFTLPNGLGTAADLYSLTTTGNTRVTLAIADDNLAANNLDIFLLTSSGDTVLDTSQSHNNLESIETPGAGTFLIAVQAVQGTSAYTLSFAFLGRLDASQSILLPDQADFTPGEILVKLKSPGSHAHRRVVDIATAHGLAPIASFPQGVALWRLSLPPTVRGIQQQSALEDTAILKARTLMAIRQLRRDPAVEYAEPNYLRQAQLIPNDPFYALQWHYELLRLPEAWDITTGDDTVIVAVIDTGVLSTHPELSSRLIDGYDFVSNPAVANDGDGIDADPTDPGDDPQEQHSSFHGTHVAGTIGAVTNNTTGIAGVTWQTRLMPLRVLGLNGLGTDADIAQAILYAAGLPNSSGTLPTTRAHIINMSLGGQGFSQTLQSAVLAAREQGVIIIAAAGNSNTSAFFSPASLDGVISVSAVDLLAEKAPYSNFGNGIDVAAPGGDLTVDLDADSFHDGILSTLGDGHGTFFFTFYQGTSMASPHVAGVVALMLARHATLTPSDIDDLLAGTHPQTTLRITNDLGAAGRDDIYGHGLIDAAAAVRAADAIANAASPSGSMLAVSTTTLTFGPMDETRTFDLTNAGTDVLTITTMTTDVPWLTLAPSSGPTPLTVTASVDRSGLPQGLHMASIQITSDATQGSPIITVKVHVQVGEDTFGNIGTVFVQLLHATTSVVLAQVETDFARQYAFTIPDVAPGTYRIVAGTDRDNNGLICEVEDACGEFSTLVTIATGHNTAAIDFTVSDGIRPLNAPTTVPPAGPFRRLDIPQQ